MAYRPIGRLARSPWQAGSLSHFGRRG